MTTTTPALNVLRRPRAGGKGVEVTRTQFIEAMRRCDEIERRCDEIDRQLDARNDHDHERSEGR